MNYPDIFDLSKKVVADSVCHIELGFSQALASCNASLVPTGMDESALTSLNNILLDKHPTQTAVYTLSFTDEAASIAYAPTYLTGFVVSTGTGYTCL